MVSTFIFLAVRENVPMITEIFRSKQASHNANRKLRLRRLPFDSRAGRGSKPCAFHKHQKKEKRK